MVGDVKRICFIDIDVKGKQRLAMSLPHPALSESLHEPWLGTAWAHLKSRNECFGLGLGMMRSNSCSQANKQKGGSAFCC